MKKVRRFARKNKVLVVIAVITIIALLLTVAILVAQLKRGTLPSFGVDMSEEKEEILYENVYVTSMADGQICFWYQQEEYTYPGLCKEAYEGIADVLVVGDEVEVITEKNDYITGTLLAYTSDQIRIEGYDWVELSELCPVYRTYEDTVTPMQLNQMVIGATSLRFCVSDNKVCAAIQEVPTMTENIRVMIKNDEEGSICYPALYLYCGQNWYANGEKLPAGQVLDTLQYLQEKGWTEMSISGEGGITRVDQNGKQIGAYYEGDLNVLLYSKEDPTLGVVLVNVLPIERYVAYVLPSEMPLTFHYEALKAQAVCARTYAYSQMKNGQYACYGANIDDSTMYQVFNENGTSDVTTQAAIDTAGQVVTCDGDLITCYYFSTTPGTTDDMEVWSAEQVPYLAKHNYTEYQGDLSSSAGVLEYLNGNYSCFDDISSFYRWEAQLLFDKEHIDTWASEQYGKLKGFTITSRTASGYVNGMDVEYEKGTVSLTKELEVRRFLGKYLVNLKLNNGNERTDFTLIPCAFFVLPDGKDSVKVADLKKENLYIKGAGFGHGLGMSQYGADAMGKAGYTYDQIISNYYNNVVITDEKNLDVWR